MPGIVSIAFLLVYVLGAFAYGSALTLSMRQASPVWAPHRRATGARPGLDLPSFALFGLSAVWFVVLALERFAEIVNGPTRGWLDVVHLVLVFGFPPLIMHTMHLAGDVRSWPQRAHARATATLAAGYVLASVAMVGSLTIVFRLVSVPRPGFWINLSIAALFTLAGAYSVALINRNPVRSMTANQRHMQRTMNGLFGLLVLLTIWLAVSGTTTLYSELINRLLGVAPLLFLSATTFYENRFEFYDLLVKRGALLLAGVLLLGAFFGALLPWLDGLPRDPSRPWIFALAAVPLLLAAPWLAGHLSRRLDRAWFGRHHTPLSAVTTVLGSMQAATDEASLLAQAEASLKDVLGVTVRLSASAPDLSDVRVAFEVEGSAADPSVWVAVAKMPGERALLSEDLTLLRSLGTVVTYLLENVRLQERRQEQDLVEQELRVQSSQSELKALRAQINPHFLFNALNTVASLIHSDPARADRAVEQLSEVFRHTLRRSESEWAPLEQELTFAAAYLDVEEARFGTRLQYTIAATSDAKRARVPSMLLHTLIENAVKHGIAHVRGRGALDVTAVVTAGRLRVAVSDNGPSEPAEGRARSGEQFGLRNVRDRLRGHFGDAASFVLERNDVLGRTVARMEMPVVAPDLRPTRGAEGLPA